MCIIIILVNGAVKVVLLSIVLFNTVRVELESVSLLLFQGVCNDVTGVIRLHAQTVMTETIIQVSRSSSA